MIDALFWYTGLTAWFLIVVAGISLLAADANDRSVRKRATTDHSHSWR
jgi:hypothetical protein